MAGQLSFAIVSTATIFLLLGSTVNCQTDPHFKENRTTIVHLFEWRWTDIAQECERFLGPQGYGGVQPIPTLTSPPNENVIVKQGDVQRPWWERYQPVSYKLETRSGTEEEFKSMVSKCNSAGVRVYVDAVINHMTGSHGTGTGTGGSYFDSGALKYDGVPYTSEDFNGATECPTPSGSIESYQDVTQVRNCRLSGLADLNHKKDNVRQKIIAYMNKLVSFGVAGFRVDASKHMWPAEMKAIFDGVDSLSTEHGFPSGARPFIVQEVIDLGGEAVQSSEYYTNGLVTEFKVCANIGNIFRKWSNQQLRYLSNWGAGWGFGPSGSSFVFIDNHDNQRGHGAGGASILTFRVSRMYKMAQAFTLAWPYGITRVMSSYYWEQNMQEGKDLNDWIGPPHDANFTILPVTLNADATCGNGWMCEHRWRQIFNMVAFRNAVQGTAVAHWWDNQKDQIAFSRGDRGFIAINNEDYALNTAIETSMSDGSYCDVISGNLVNGKCTGKTITVSGGKVNVNIANTDEDPMVAIHAGTKL